MSFVDFLNRYYSESQRSEISFILHELQIYKKMEICMNDFYASVHQKNKIEIISYIVLTCRELVIMIYNSTKHINSYSQEPSIEQKLILFVGNLIDDTCRLSQMSSAEYQKFLEAIVKKIYEKNFWNFSRLSKFRTVYVVTTKTTILKTNAERAGGTSPYLKRSMPLRLDWQGRKPLDLFIFDLVYVFKISKYRKQVYYLFSCGGGDFKIELESKHLLPFLSLFYELHKSQIIRVVGNRGLFVYLSQHLQPPSHDRYPNRDFRKIREEANTKLLTKEVIYKKINPLLEKYCIDTIRTINGR